MIVVTTQCIYSTHRRLNKTRILTRDQNALPPFVWPCPSILITTTYSSGSLATGLLALLSAGGLLRTLDIQGCSQLSELCLMGLQRAAFTSTNLTSLDLRGMAIADIAFGWVAQARKHFLSQSSFRRLCSTVKGSVLNQTWRQVQQHHRLQHHQH